MAGDEMPMVTVWLTVPSPSATWMVAAPGANPAGSAALIWNGSEAKRDTLWPFTVTTGDLDPSGINPVPKIENNSGLISAAFELLAFAPVALNSCPRAVDDPS
jgi:hypothetical protein